DHQAAGLLLGSVLGGAGVLAERVLVFERVLGGDGSGLGLGLGLRRGALTSLDLVEDRLGLGDLLGVLVPFGVGHEVGQVLLGLVAVADLPGCDADLVGEPVLARDQVVGLLVERHRFMPLVLGGQRLGLDVELLGLLLFLGLAQLGLGLGIRLGLGLSRALWRRRYLGEGHTGQREREQQSDGDAKQTHG